MLIKKKATPQPLQGVRFTERELTFPRINQFIKEIITEKLAIQKNDKYYSFNDFEFKVLATRFGDFVPKERYDNDTEFKGEKGKIRGKRVVVE